MTSIYTDTTTPLHVAGLCRALASTGLRVVVVDTALGPVPVASLLGVEAREGTPDWLRTIDALTEKVVRSDYDSLYVVPDRWPTEFIGLPNWSRKALDQLAGGFDIGDVQQASGASAAVVRRVISGEVDAGNLTDQGPDPITPVPAARRPSTNASRSASTSSTKT